MATATHSGITYQKMHTLGTPCTGCDANEDVNICDAMPDDCVDDHSVVWMKLEPTQRESSCTQVGGTHYQNKIQPWDIIDAWDLDYYEGNVLKYLLRYKQKNGSQDLKKAAHYLIRVSERWAEKNGEPS